MGSISVNVRGSSDGADRAIQQKADAYGARYYTIMLKQEHAFIMLKQEHALSNVCGHHSPCYIAKQTR
ncbi:MAG: YdgH/BhsA/McbA-like domain containing protein [Symbiopectobacterium sp.]